MKKNSSTMGKKSSKRLLPRHGSRKPVDLDEIRRKIANLVGAEAGPMVESAIEEAHKGHFGAMKYLFEIVGLYPAADAEPGPSDNSLARTLLHRLGLPEEAMPEDQTTNNQAANEGRNAAGHQEDAVE